MATPTEGRTIVRQWAVFDLDTMEEITLKKEKAWAPVSSAKEALERVANDTAAFLQIVNDGLMAAEERALVADSSIPWLQEDEEDGTLKTFVGAVADKKAVNMLRLTLAKTVFGFAKGMKPKEKQAAKEAALEMIRTSDKIKAALDTQAREQMNANRV